MDNIMIDTESLGTNNDSVIFSLGACYFDIATGAIGKTYYTTIDIQSQLDMGRKIYGKTVQWWMGQCDQARAEIQKPGKDFGEVLLEFHAWVDKDAKVWANGSCFDIAILNDVYGPDAPWKFWNVRDCRTIEDLASHKIDRKSIPFTGTQHNSLDDAIHQAKYVSKMWKALRT